MAAFPASTPVVDIPLSFAGNTDENLAQIDQIEIRLRQHASPTPTNDMGKWGYAREFSSNGVRWFLLYKGKEAPHGPSEPRAYGYVANVMHALYREMHEEMYWQPDMSADQPAPEPTTAPELTLESAKRRITRLEEKLALSQELVLHLNEKNQLLDERYAAAKKENDSLRVRYATQRKIAKRNAAS